MVVLIDYVYLVGFAAQIHLLEILCNLESLVCTWGVTQIVKGLYHGKSALCDNILAPAAADNN